MTNFLTAVEGFAGVAIPAVGFLYTYTANRRAQYDRVLVMTDQSCTSPIADDRHVAGTAFEPIWKHPPGEPVKLSEAEIKAVYNVLWYFGRADALYVSLHPPIWSGHIQGYFKIAARSQLVTLGSHACGSSVCAIGHRR